MISDILKRVRKEIEELTLSELNDLMEDIEWVKEAKEKEIGESDWVYEQLKDREIEDE